MNSTSDQPQQRVLLCLLKPSQPVEGYSPAMLRQVFEPFGRVLALRVIEKNVKLKAFVEFETHEQMERARTALHKTEVKGFGIFEAFVSRKQGVSTRASNYDSSEQDCLSQAERGGPADDLLPTLEGVAERRPRFPLYSMEDLAFVPRREFHPKLFSLSEIPEPEELKPRPGPNSDRVLMFNRLDFTRVNKRMLANLLSCFGVVLQVIINLESFFALVEMKTHLEAQTVMEKLAGLCFFGKPLKIKFSKYRSLSFKRMDSEFNPRLDTFEVPSSFHRATDAATRVGDTLRFAGLPPDTDPKILCDLLTIVHKPLGLMRLKNPDPSCVTSTYLVQFPSPSHAIDILSVFHGKEIDSYRVEVSFSNDNLMSLECF